MATILIFGGYFPGYLPPIDAAPQGAPAARPAWKSMIIPFRTAKMYAAIVTVILISHSIDSMI